jgi:23S rRNA pseudouridine1911/1915/1917 synthase
MADRPIPMGETGDWLVLDKPAGMHTAPLEAGEKGTLVDFARDFCPAIAGVPGIKPTEPGLLHRLDRETSGLVLFAKTPEAFGVLLAHQKGNRFTKEYRALCLKSEGSPAADGGPEEKSPGSGSEAAFAAWPFTGSLERFPLERGVVISSAFRAWGPGRARVAPVNPAADGAVPYETRILEVADGPAGLLRVTVSLTRGFRHQVRVHLAASGFPIAGDPLYEPAVTAGRYPRMWLHSSAIEFPDPATGLIVRLESPEPF